MRNSGKKLTRSWVENEVKPDLQVIFGLNRMLFAQDLNALDA